MRMSLDPTNYFGISVSEFIEYALKEDVGDGDHTSLSTIPEGLVGKADVKVKEKGVIAGIELTELIIKTVDPMIQQLIFLKEGADVNPGDIVMTLNGNVRSLLKAERLLLNCMQRMSGIATLTRKYVEAIAGTNCKVLDTRKTTPNFRLYEKMAVELGGGFNHRFGLYDMILIKDNHVDASGGVKNAIESANQYIKNSGKLLKIEIETRNLDEVKEVLSIGNVNRIMLDNFTPDLLKEAIAMIDKKYETEASGGITLETIRSFAVTGVDFISVGALTHSHRSLDISMKILS